MEIYGLTKVLESYAGYGYIFQYMCLYTGVLWKTLKYQFRQNHPGFWISSGLLSGLMEKATRLRIPMSIGYINIYCFTERSIQPRWVDCRLLLIFRILLLQVTLLLTPKKQLLMHLCFFTTVFCRS